MTLRLLPEHPLELLSLKGGCTCSSDSTVVKMPHCWKSPIMAQLYQADLLAPDGDAYCIFVTFLCGILGQVWYLIVSFPDVGRLSYFE